MTGLCRSEEAFAHGGLNGGANWTKTEEAYGGREKMWKNLSPGAALSNRSRVTLANADGQRSQFSTELAVHRSHMIDPAVERTEELP